MTLFKLSVFAILLAFLKSLFFDWHIELNGFWASLVIVSSSLFGAIAFLSILAKLVGGQFQLK